MRTTTHLPFSTGPHRSRSIAAIPNGLLLLCVLCLSQLHLHAQATPVATRSGDVQVGATFNLADSDYAPERFRGYGFYATFDVRYHLGLEAAFRQLNGTASSQGLYERTYEIGPRYVVHIGRLEPYVKAMYGRGVFNFPTVGNASTGSLGANLAYNIAAGSIGADYRLTRSINLRAEYEYQRWMGFPPNGLTPTVASIGAAYHF